MNISQVYLCLCRRPTTVRGNLEGLNDEGEVVENYKVVKRLIGHQSGKNCIIEMWPYLFH